MMIGERNNHAMTVHVPPRTLTDDPTAGMITPFPLSPNTNAYFLGDDYSSISPFQRYLASNDVVDDDPDGDGSGADLDMSSEMYSGDSFRMFEFKVRKCALARSHDWTDCPFAHHGEKARRRDPRKYNYSGTSCPEFRKGTCKKGDGCEYAHGVFECWLHPSRYRTQPCKDGVSCRRRVCFFAHTPEQLRVLSPMSDRGGMLFMSSPETSSPPSESPPRSPMTANSLSRSLGSPSVGDMVASLRQLHLNKVKSMPTWGLQLARNLSGATRSGYCSLPSTPTRSVTRSGLGYLEHWDKGCLEEEPVMWRVESGRDLRAKMFEKLSKENPLDRVDPNPPESPNPDVGWISELVK